MPPWHADSSVRAYANDRALSEAEIALITRWVEAGAPQGDPAELPPPIEEADLEWSLGAPDVVVGMDQPFAVPAEGGDIYRCFVLDPGLTQDRWIVKVEVQPGQPSVDHHVALVVDARGDSDGMKSEDGLPGYSCFGAAGGQGGVLGGWAPGGTPRVYPEGVGHRLPAGAKIIMQMHYHPAGTAVEDRTRVGLHFSDRSDLKQMRDGYAANFRIDIPAGAADYTLESHQRIMRPITIYSVAPHMHLLGKAMDIWAELPDGGRLDLLRVPRYDFNWQTEYVLAEPVQLPRRSVIRGRAVYDNTAANPNQPSDPPRRVGYGEQSTDEMMFAIFFHTIEETDVTGF
jgi:hypothetical protein